MATMTRRRLSGWRTRNGLKLKIKRAARRRTATYAWIIYKRQSAGRTERTGEERADGRAQARRRFTAATCSGPPTSVKPLQHSVSLSFVFGVLANKTNYETAFIAACSR